MKIEDEFILQGTTLTGLKNWLNENKEKKTGKKFTVSDVQQYANKTGQIPVKYGGNQIIIHEDKYNKNQRIWLARTDNQEKKEELEKLLRYGV